MEELVRMEKLNVAIADDNERMVDLLSTLVKGDKELELVGQSADGQEIYKEYQLQLRKLNYGLSRLPQYCRMQGIKISSYTARHTWATLAKYCQIPEEIISEGLGHSSLKVTRTYLKSFEGDELAKANRIVMEYIFTGKKNTWTTA